MISRNNTTIATPPGETIKDLLENRNISWRDFAFQMGMSDRQAMDLLEGRMRLTQETAERLEKVLGVPAKFWNSLETIYRKKAKRIEQDMLLPEK